MKAGITHLKSGKNEGDDETVIMDENGGNLPRADMTFEEYVITMKEKYPQIYTLLMFLMLRTPIVVER